MCCPHLGEEDDLTRTARPIEVLWMYLLVENIHQSNEPPCLQQIISTCYLQTNKGLENGRVVTTRCYQHHSQRCWTGKSQRFSIKHFPLGLSANLPRNVEETMITCRSTWCLSTLKTFEEFCIRQLDLPWKSWHKYNVMNSFANNLSTRRRSRVRALKVLRNCKESGWLVKEAAGVWSGWGIRAQSES